MTTPPNSRPLTDGERKRLAELVEAVGPRVLAYVRHAFGGRVDAEEVTAETFLRAASNFESALTCDRPDLYVLTIARNLCRDVLRRRRPEPVAGEWLDEQPQPAAEPPQRLTELETQRELALHVSRLPEAQREVVVLRVSAGLTFQQIADLLGIPLATALSRMHAALRRLRSDLGCVHEH